MGSASRFASLLFKTAKKQKIPVRSFRKQMGKTIKEYKTFKRTLKNIKSPKKLREAAIIMSWRSNITKDKLHRSFMKLVRKEKKRSRNKRSK